MLTAPLLLQGDPSQEQEGGPPGLWHAASSWHKLGKQEISWSGMAAKSIREVPGTSWRERRQTPLLPASLQEQGKEAEPPHRVERLLREGGLRRRPSDAVSTPFGGEYFRWCYPQLSLILLSISAWPLPPYSLPLFCKLSVFSPALFSFLFSS